MKVVLALLLVCLIQISFGEQEDLSDGASSELNLSLQREVREAARGCEMGDKKCRRNLREEQRKEEKEKRKNRRKVKKSKTKNGLHRTSSTSGNERKLNQKKKGSKDTKKRQTKKSRKRTSSTSGNERTNSTTCFTDLVAKTKKFNKAQVELRLANRMQSWAKLMKNKKNTSASTFGDALEAMNEATGNGTGCSGDSSSFAEAKKVQEKLANCSVSAGANCDEGKLSVPINSTLVSSCKTTLGAFAKDFKDCLVKSTDAETCSCVQGLTNPSAACLDFKTMHDGLKSQKEKCTKGSEEGSFGDCRKQERMAAKFGNKCKQSCKGPGGQVTTQAPAVGQRMKLLRKVYNQKMNFL